MTTTTTAAALNAAVHALAAAAPVTAADRRQTLEALARLAGELSPTLEAVGLSLRDVVHCSGGLPAEFAPPPGADLAAAIATAAETAAWAATQPGGPGTAPHSETTTD